MSRFDTSYETIDSPFSEGRDQNEALSSDTILKIFVVLVLLYLVWNDSWSIQIIKNEKQTQEMQLHHDVAAASQTVAMTAESEAPRRRVGVKLPESAKSYTAFYIDPNFAERYGISKSEIRDAQDACTEYVQRYASVAISEMKKYGIPASITLAQGLLESNAGHSRLAKTTNNHFGIKCFSRKCKKGHCKNFSDDTHKDFFVAYPNIWGSFRAHSKFLKNGKRYRALFDLQTDNYKAWAKGLSAAGYATDPKYALKLIALIENLDLHQFDEH